MPSKKLSTAESVARINVTDIEIEGVWMPCEYVEDRAGRVRVVMLADIETEVPASRATWHATVADAAESFFKAVGASRKLAVRQAVPGRAIEDCPFRQFLKRDLFDRAVS
jgi:hypothetical protein